MPAAEKSSLKKPHIESLGIVAGGGVLPARLALSCRAAGIDLFIVGFEGQTDPAIMQGGRHMMTRVGAVGQIISTLKSHNIRDLVFIGSIRRPTLADLRPDMRTAAFFARIGLRALGDNGLLTALRSELERDGFRIHGAHEFIDDLLAPEGIIGRIKPDKRNLADVMHGFKIAGEIGRLDIGQAVIVQNGIVLGVEAAEGTDELIKRCGPLRRKGAGGVLVKMCKPGQDMDFDLPTCGPQTVRLCAQAGLSGVAVHAGHSLMIDPQEMADIANTAKMFIGGFNPDSFVESI